MHGPINIRSEILITKIIRHNFVESMCETNCSVTKYVACQLLLFRNP